MVQRALMARKRKDGSVIQVRAIGRAVDASDRKKGSVWTHEDT